MISTNDRERRFNLAFNIFLLLGMLVALSLTTVFKLQQPGARPFMLLLAAFGAMMGIVNTVLSANGHILTFVFGFIDVVVATVVCYENGIMGNFALHAFYFLPMQFIGFWQWRKRGAEGGKQVRARRFTRRHWLYFAIAVVAGFALAYGVLYGIDRAKVASGALEAVDSVKLVTDAAALVFNILGQVLLSLAFAEQWICWLLVNAFSITIWANALSRGGADASALVMLLKYSFYFVNALNGLRIWLKLSRPTDVSIAPPGEA